MYCSSTAVSFLTTMSAAGNLHSNSLSALQSHGVHDLLSSTQLSDTTRPRLSRVFLSTHAKMAVHFRMAWPSTSTGSRRANRFDLDRKSTRLNSSHLGISYAVFCL